MTPEKYQVTGTLSGKPTCVVLFALILMLNSCVTQRDVEYLRDNVEKKTSFKEADFPAYRLKPNDELYIQINSLDEEAANLFSYARQQSVYLGSIQPYGASLISYTIDKDGYLYLPVIGKIHALDKTVGEVSSMLRDSLSHILNQPIVAVKLVNKFVSVVGEVRNPGHYPYSQEKLSVFDALSLAGDMTDYGNRKQVLLVRNENGENKSININLTRPDFLAADFYYIRPNDMLYVRPLKKKFWGFRQFPFEIVLSTITTGLLIYNIVK